MAKGQVTAADIARSLGISRATVGYVLNNTPGQTISETTSQRVLEEAKRLGYRPHAAARALASGRSRIVLLVLPDWPRDHSLQSHLDQAGAALDDAGYSLVTMTQRAGSHAQPLWETLAPDVVLAMAPLTEDEMSRIRDSGVKHLISPDPVDHEVDEQHLGFADGPRLQVEHLLANGRRRLAYAGSTDPRLADLVDQRRRSANTVHRLTATANVDKESVADIVERWVAEGVDGVVAYNDDIAALVLGAALRAGIRVPAQLAVVGHDDAPLAELFVPGITSIRIDTVGLGRYLAALALSVAEPTAAAVERPEAVASLVVRETSVETD